MEDSQIIALYWQKNEDAIIESNRQYGAYCFKIANNILYNPEDAEECVNDTWFHVWNAIPPKRPQKLAIFLAKITRNLAFNRFNARIAKKRGSGEIAFVLDELAECLPSDSNVENEYETKELGQHVQWFVRTLSERDANVFVRRYFFTDSVKDIAERYGLTENNIMVILSRTRKKLKKYLMKEGLVNE